MAYYDQIAKQWHRLTGFRGGALKEQVLNDLILNKIDDIDGRAILELGAGNGYFMPLLLKRFSGRGPARIVITDESDENLSIARRYFPIDAADHQPLNVRQPFPYEPESFDYILATMIFNEISDATLHNALASCRRVLRPGGKLIATVTHPEFVASLARRGLLKRHKGCLTMTGSGGLRLPVVKRSIEGYRSAIEQASFDCACDDVYPTEKVLNAKRGLREAGNVPIALVLECHR